MRYLRTNTAARVSVGPFFDNVDGITPETALTVTNCKLTLVVDVANVPTLVLDVAPTASAGANDMVHVTGDDAGFYDLELAAANVNYLGRAMLAITDAANHCPVFHEFMILPAMVYDAMVLGTDVLQADVTQLLGTGWLTPATAGTPDINVKFAGGTAWNSGAITSSTIGTDALTSTGLAASFVTELQSGLATAANLAVIDGVVAAILVDTADMQPKFGFPPDYGSGATFGGNMADIGGHTSAIANLPAATADAVWDEDMTIHQNYGTAGLTLGDPVVSPESLWGMVEAIYTNTYDGITGRIKANTTHIAGSTAQAEITARVQVAIETNKLDHLVAVADADDVVDDSIIAKLASKGVTADWSSFANTTDSLEANRDNIGTTGAGLTAADDAVLAAIATLNNITAASVWSSPTRTLSALGFALGAGDFGTDWLTSTGLAASAVAEIQSGLSTHSADNVWAVATRILTAGTNIVLAKGTGVTGFNDLSAAQVNAEILDVLTVDTFSLPGQGTPTSTPTLAECLRYLYKFARNPIEANKVTGEQSYLSADGLTVDHKRTIADDGTTFSLGVLATGA